ncbi:protein tyrosine phosphatase-like protein [Helicosporidium sp. ATCC 50920]|nr:protein tyrosine phosphatase-like protein [Helicosporidium sp. ATCC 50920]|eukprot:KDD75900.1 protein tyrosine phosphatase-like protein [Helicosporidium sp. ATCC 50920]
MTPKGAYLFTYNIIVGALWAHVLYDAIVAWMTHGTLPAVWEATATPLKFAQTPALLEVLHSVLGLVRSPPLVTGLQVASRLWLTWGVVALVPGATTTQAVTLLSAGGQPVLQLSLLTLLGAWSVTEVIRYAFFALKELGLEPYPLLWLRYSSFVVLYPLGVASELAMVYLAMPSIRAERPWSLTMPNSLNASFDYYVVCWSALFLYVPGFPKLYSYMLAQRSKVLGAGGKAKARKNE